MMRFLSWGCGVQSTVLGEMSARGELEPLDAVITADTGWERRATYEIRDFYAKRWREMGLHVEIVSVGDIRRLGATEHINIPFWTSSGGPLKRQCTFHFKIMPIRRRIREYLGYHPSNPPHPPANSAELWLGISLDEWTRAKPGWVKFVAHRWPLLERKMARLDCVKWLESLCLPVPPKSACVCCPYRRASEWLEMREQAPDEFEAAVEFDEKNRHNPLAENGGSTADALYIYKSGNQPEPLISANLEADAMRERRRYGDIQIPMMFCESGHCWV